jgi:hypothetical protein
MGVHFEGLISWLFSRWISFLSGCKFGLARPKRQPPIKKLKQHHVDSIGAGAGVSEPGLNRRPEKLIA